MHNATSGRSNRACAKQLSIGTAEAIKIAQENDFSCIYQNFFVILHRKIIMTQNNNILEQIKKLGKKVLPKGSHLLLYGSRARGDNRPDSDWDLLVLLNRQQNVNADFANISYPLMELGFDLGQYFSVHTYSQEEWNSMNFMPFYKNVERDKIQLV